MQTEQFCWISAAVLSATLNSGCRPDSGGAEDLAGAAMDLSRSVADMARPALAFTTKDFAVGTAPNSIAVADFNRDGQLDLVVANSLSNNVSVLLGKGAGEFAVAVNYPVGKNPQAVAVGDVNGI